MNPKKIVFLVTGLSVLIFSAIMIFYFLRLKNNRDQQAKAVELIVWTHSSFIDGHGPGAYLKEEFEKTCDCTVVFEDAGGGPLVIEKLKLEPNQRVDLLLGIDFLLLDRLLTSVKAQNINRPKINWEPKVSSFVLDRAVPYDWSPMGFIVRKDKIQNNFRNLKEFFADIPDGGVIIQDPSLSTPGLEFLYWAFSEIKAEWPEFIGAIKPKVYSYNPSWSAAYGLFQKGEAIAVFSYLTSLLYHWDVERSEEFDFITFEEPHPAQLEYAIVPDNCWSCALAKEFVEFMVTPEAQVILAQKNFMLPVNLDAEASLSGSFKRLPKVEILPIETAAEFTRQSETILKTWSDNR